MSIIGIDPETGFLIGLFHGKDDQFSLYQRQKTGQIVLAGEVFLFEDGPIRAFYPEWIEWIRTDGWINSVLQFLLKYPFRYREGK